MQVAQQAQQTKPPAQLTLQGGFFGVAINIVIEELLTAKDSGNRRKRYTKSLRYYLEQFVAGRETTPITGFSTADVEGWMSKYSSSWTRKTWLSRISTLFSFAVRRGYLPANPCDRIERVITDCQPPKNLTPAQADLLLKIAPTVCRPYLILGLFAGIRPEEIQRMDWPNINLETKTARVEGKTRRRRIVILEPRAIALLQNCPLKTGPVTPSASTITRFKIRMREALGLPRFPQDLLRHTFASYALALHKDAGKVSTSMGNSSAVLLRHYHEPVTQKDCDLFWQDGHTKYDPVGLDDKCLPAQSAPNGKAHCQDQPKDDARNETSDSRTRAPQAT